MTNKFLSNLKNQNFNTKKQVRRAKKKKKKLVKHFKLKFHSKAIDIMNGCYKMLKEEDSRILGCYFLQIYIKRS